MNVEVLRAAEAELSEAVAYYDLQRDGLGSELVDAFDEAMRRVLDFPEAWSKTVRCCIFKRFEYGIIYTICNETIFVLAVMHLKRRPGYWKKRLREIPD